MLNINGDNWSIILVPSNYPTLQQPNGLYTIGSCNNKNKTIYINENINEFYLEKVLYHELIHACMYSYNIKLNRQQEEAIAELMATYGHEFINTTDDIINKLSYCRNKKMGNSCFI